MRSSAPPMRLRTGAMRRSKRSPSWSRTSAGARPPGAPRCRSGTRRAGLADLVSIGSVVADTRSMCSPPCVVSSSLGCRVSSHRRNLVPNRKPNACVSRGALDRWSPRDRPYPPGPGAALRFQPTSSPPTRTRRSSRICPANDRETSRDRRERLEHRIRTSGTRFGASPQVVRSIPRTLSRWRHGFEPRWDYNCKVPGQGTSHVSMSWLNTDSNPEYPANIPRQIERQRVRKRWRASRVDALPNSNAPHQERTFAGRSFRPERVAAARP